MWEQFLNYIAEFRSDPDNDELIALTFVMNTELFIMLTSLPLCSNDQRHGLDG